MVQNLQFSDENNSVLLVFMILVFYFVRFFLLCGRSCRLRCFHLLVAGRVIPPLYTVACPGLEKIYIHVRVFCEIAQNTLCALHGKICFFCSSLLL